MPDNPPPARWRCKRLDSDPENGFNDASSTTFKKDPVHSLVRETLQNCLDAKPEPENLSEAEKDLPVEVEYSLFEIDTANFPDVDRFRTILKACSDEADENEPDAKKFFIRASALMKRPKLKMLRISDRNTRGLQGADTDSRTGTWHRLVKMRGGANLSARAGGSFGIGKGAAFLVSPLRTVFYSSVARNNVPDSPPGYASHVGCAHLTTYRDETGAETTGFVFFTDNDRNMAIPGTCTFGEAGYARNECGTDLYIAGFDPGAHEFTVDTFVDRVRAEVLDNFLLTLKLGKLSFRLLVDGTERLRISKDNLAEEIGKLPVRRQGKRYEQAVSTTLDRAQTVRRFWDLTQGAGEKSEAIEDDKGAVVFPAGAFTFWMKKDESSSTEFRTSRSAGMTIGTLKHLSGSIGCLGFLTITDPDMDAQFRAMENPLHTEWDPQNRNSTDDIRKSRGLLDRLRGYLKDLIQKRFGPKIGTTIDELEGLGCSSSDDSGANDGYTSSMKLVALGENGALPTRSLLSGGIRAGGGLGNNPWTPGGGKKGRNKTNGTRNGGPAAGGGDKADGFRPDDFAEQPRVFARGGESAAQYRCSIKLPAGIKRNGTVRLYFNSVGETTASFELPVADFSIVHSAGNRISSTFTPGRNWVEFGHVGPGDEIAFDVRFSGISHYVYVNMALRTASRKE